MCRPVCVLVIALFAELVHSWEIALTAGDRLEFYTNYGTKTNTVHLESQNLTALAYDEVHSMLLYVDKQSNNDAICGYNLTSMEYKCYIERHGRNIHGLAFDPVTEMLFFTDTKERSINSFSFKPESTNIAFGNLLIAIDIGIPSDIVVDSCRGYIYWINTNLETSVIERARFDGSEREVVIHSNYSLGLHSLALDQQTQKIYWIEPETRSRSYVYSADLDGKNWVVLTPLHFATGNTRFSTPNTLIASEKYLWSMDWCFPCSGNNKYVWKFPKQIKFYHPIVVFEINTEKNDVGLAANYKMIDQFQGIPDCKHVLNNFETIDLYCVHGIKSSLNGQSVCKCTLGYTGVRCEVSVCENYCLQGNCSFTEEGLPICRCNAGYSGERCEVNVCHGYCLNNGTCSLDEEDDAACECQGQYGGARCEFPVDINSGDGSRNVEVEPARQCDCSHGSSGDTADQNKTTSTTSTHFSPEGNLKISVVVEVKSNN